jgi:hypothetical protein
VVYVFLIAHSFLWELFPLTCVFNKGSTYGVVLKYTLQTVPSMPTAQYYTWVNGWDELTELHRQWPKVAMAGGSGYFGGWPAAGDGFLGTVVIKVTLPNSTWPDLRRIMKPIMEEVVEAGKKSNSVNDNIDGNNRTSVKFHSRSADEIRGNYTQFRWWHEAEASLSVRKELSLRRTKGTGSSRPGLSELSIWDMFPGIGANKILVSWLYSSQDLQSPNLKEALIGALNDTGTVYLNDATMGIGTHNPPFMRGGGNAVNPAFRTAVMRPAAEMQWMGMDRDRLALKKQQAKQFGAALQSVNPQGGTYANEVSERPGILSLLETGWMTM